MEGVADLSETISAVQSFKS